MQLAAEEGAVKKKKKKALATLQIPPYLSFCARQTLGHCVCTPPHPCTEQTLKCLHKLLSGDEGGKNSNVGSVNKTEGNCEQLHCLSRARKWVLISLLDKFASVYFEKKMKCHVDPERERKGRVGSDTEGSDPSRRHWA